MRENKRMISITQGILIQAIFFYFIYGLASAVLGFWWARKSIQKISQKKKRGRGETYICISHCAFLRFCVHLAVCPVCINKIMHDAKTRKL